MGLVELYVNYSGVLDRECVRKLVHTNAPKDIIQSVCNDVATDGIHKRGAAIEGIINILVARGYECLPVEDVPRFGFSE